MEKRKKKYWAGFCDGKINWTHDLYHGRDILAIYVRKKDAQESYQDVRAVKIITKRGQ